MFKCRFCGSYADDGDLINYVCLYCIDLISQYRTHELNKNLDFKKAVKKAEKRKLKKEVK